MIPLQTTSDCNSEMPMVPVCHGNLQYLARNPRSRLRCDPRALVAEWARGRPCAASGSGADGSRQFRINSRAAGSRATRSSRPATGFGYASCCSASTARGARANRHSRKHSCRGAGRGGEAGGGKAQGRASPAMGREAPAETTTRTKSGRAKSQGRHRAATIRGRAGENANASVSSVRFGMKVVSSLAAYTSSSVQTLKLTRMFGPKVWVIGTSAASRPWAIRTRPIRGMLLRASKVYQWPPI